MLNEYILVSSECLLQQASVMLHPVLTKCQISISTAAYHAYLLQTSCILPSGARRLDYQQKHHE